MDNKVLEWWCFISDFERFKIIKKAFLEEKIKELRGLNKKGEKCGKKRV